MGKYCKSEKFPIGQPKASFLKKNYASFFKKACIIFEKKKRFWCSGKTFIKKNTWKIFQDSALLETFRTVCLETVEP